MSFTMSVLKKIFTAFLSIVGVLLILNSCVSTEAGSSQLTEDSQLGSTTVSTKQPLQTLTSSPAVSETTTYVLNTETPVEDDGTGMYYMGMKHDDFLSIVRENGWLIDRELMNNSYDFDEIIYYNTEYLRCGRFTFNEQNQLIGMSIVQPNIKTSKGIAVGDTVEKMKAAYGRQPVEQWGDPTVVDNDPGVYFVYHPSPTTALEFEVYGDTITSWELKLR
jgi:hypothetical protein